MAKKMIGMRLEDYEAMALKVIAKERGVSLTELVKNILRERIHDEMLGNGLTYMQAIKKLAKRGK